MAQSWTGIRVSAGLAILGSALMLLFAGVALLAGLYGQSFDTGAPSAPYKPIMLAMAAFLLALSVWGIATGICIFLRQRWARISILVFAVLLTFTSAGAVLSAFFIDLAATSEVRQAQPFLAAVKWVVAGCYLMLTGLGVWWLVLFNRPSAKEYFAGQGPVVESARPLSITFIAWLLLIGVACWTLGAILRIPAIMFGFIVTGWATLAIYTVYAAADLYIGSALLQLREEGRIGAIVYFAFALLNGVVSLMRVNSAEMMRRMQETMPRLFPADIPPATAVPMWFTAALTAVICGVPIFFLVRRREAFSRP